jgi:hypothetical protein
VRSIGAHARALQYFESHLRRQHGAAGLNPAAFTANCSYAQSEVSFLLEVYAQLDEPDGLAGESLCEGVLQLICLMMLHGDVASLAYENHTQVNLGLDAGLMQLRQGGLSASDQVLAAEKAGAWSEALALYEQALGNEREMQTTIGHGAQVMSAGTVTGGSEVRHSTRFAARDASNACMHGWMDGWMDGWITHQMSWIAGARVAGAAASSQSAAAITPVSMVTADGLPVLQQGQLRCLLHMGHLQSLTNQVGVSSLLLLACLSQTAPELLLAS